MQDRKSEPSIGDLFGDLTRDMSTLVRQEVQLAKTELSQKAVQVGKDAASIAIGGAIAYAGLLVLLAALVIILGTIGVPWWIASLLVALIAIGVGALLIMRGRDALKRADLAPNRTIEGIKEDAEWVKEHTR
jgi:hypothetical protein